MTITNLYPKSSAALIAHPSAYTKVIDSVPEYPKTAVVSRLQEIEVVTINLLTCYSLENSEPEKRRFYMGLDAYPFPHIKRLRIKAIAESIAK